MSPTQRTLEECKRLGWLAGVVERWQQQSRRRIDLFGFVDVVAIENPNYVNPPRFIAIQATSGSNVAARVRKINEECREAADAWRAAGGVIEVWGWARHKKAVDRKFWRVRRVRV